MRTTPIVETLLQRRHVRGKVRFFDDGVGPDGEAERLLVGQVAMALDEVDEQVESDRRQNDQRRRRAEAVARQNPPGGVRTRNSRGPQPPLTSVCPLSIRW